MSTMATSGTMRPDGGQELVGCAGLGDDVEAGLDEQARDPLPQQERVVGEDEPESHAPSVRERIARTRELLLGDEAQDGAARQPRPVGARLAARRQHHERGRTVDRELTGDVEPLDVGQADVEQNENRSQRPGGVESRGPGIGLADHHEAVRLEQCPRLGAERGMVVDDQDRVHAPIVAPGLRRRYRANPASRSVSPRGCARGDGSHHHADS